MEEEKASESVFTTDEYELFKKIYDGFCYLMDNKNAPANSKYSYRQTRFFQNLTGFWPIIKSICQKLKLECKLTLDDLNHIIFGFNQKKVFELFANDNYEGIPPQKMLVLMELEEERLKIAAKRFFDNIMVKLDITFDKSTCIGPNIEPLKDEWVPIPILQFIPSQPVKKKKTKAEKTPAKLQLTPECGHQKLSFQDNSSIADEELTNEQAVKLLGGGISKGTITKWVKSRLLTDNGKSGRQHRVMKSSVLLLKTNREKEREIERALDKYRVDNAKR